RAMSTPPNATALAPAHSPQPPTGLVSEVFGVIEKQAQLETAAQVLAEQAKAAVQARYIMAMKNPRDWDVVRQRLLKECERPSSRWRTTSQSRGFFMAM